MSLEKTILELHSNGMTRRDIASAIGCSSHTVSKYIKESHRADELALRIMELRREGKTYDEIKELTNASKSTISKWCSSIGLNKSIRRTYNKPKPHKAISRDSYRQWKNNIRSLRKEFLLELAGSKCCICGYAKCRAALHFHHTTPNKIFNINGVKLECSLDHLLNEVEKCILVCSNCHFEIHNGLLDVSHIERIKRPAIIPDHIVDYDPLELDDDVIKKEIEWIDNKKQASRRELKERSHACFNIHDVIISECTRKEINTILNDYHYLGASNKHGVADYKFIVDDKVVGAAMVTNPVRATGFDGVYEISRFVLTVDKKNLASKCLSLLIAKLKEKEGVKYVQAFAEKDTHLGTIYKAAGFRESGGSRSTYNYDGIHKKTIYEHAASLGMTEHQYADKFGLNRIIEPGKIKFIKNIS